MAEQKFRPPLSLLPLTRPSSNVLGNTLSGPALKAHKRTYEQLGLDANVIKNGTKTPTKNCTTTAANGRKSVKRVKAEVNENTEAATARMRSNAEAEYAAKMKAWVASYKKQFPYLRFFFDACPEEDVRRCTRKIIALGGSIEPFFSNNVNVVVTSRELPKLPTDKDPNESAILIHPAHNNQHNSITHVPISIHPNGKPHEVQIRQEASTHDVLVKAQNLNIKIWSLRKLRDSVLKNLVADQNTITQQRSLLTTLRTEKFIGTGEENIVPFSGPYILVRDMNEQYRPIICREWATVSNAKDGEWPQWRATRPGRCPFIRDKTAEKNIRASQVTQVRPERPLGISQFQHANASGIQQITSAIQSNLGRSGWSGKENIGSGIANLHKKAVTTKRNSKLNATIDPTDAKKVKVDVKAGYCENCREKFDDFEAHLRTRQHRNYAKNEANFVDLDDLLVHLVRPPRIETSIDHI